MFTLQSHNINICSGLSTWKYIIKTGQRKDKLTAMQHCHKD